MKFVDSSPTKEEAKHTVGVILTGNGTQEVKVMKGFCSKFNGKTWCLQFPKTPIRRLSKKQIAGKGLQTFDTIKAIDSIKHLENIIILFDYDFAEEIEKQSSKFKTFDDALNYKLSRTFNESKIVERKETDLDRIYHIEGKIGRNNINCYLVIHGKEKMIEENISKLIKLKYNKTIAPTHKDVREFLVSEGSSVSKLIKISGKAKLKEAFPSLCEVMEKMEQIATLKEI